MTNITYSKTEMFNELIIAIDHHHCFNYEVYGSEKLPLNFRNKLTHEVCSNTKIWHLMGFIYDYVVNNVWDESSPVVTFDGGWLIRTDPLAIAEAFLESVIASEGALPMLNHDGDDASMEGGVCDMLVRKAVAKAKIDRINSHICYVRKRPTSFTAAEVASLADIQLQTVRNALSKGGELDGSSNSIAPEEVLRWLESKNRYSPTRFINSIKGLGPITFQYGNDMFEWIKGQVERLQIEPSRVDNLIGLDLNRPVCQPGDSFTLKPLTNWLKFAELLEVDPKWLVYTLIRVHPLFPYSFVVEALNVFDNEVKPTELVPTAKDGSSFLPNCRSKNGFRIGPKGAEMLYADYWSALEALKAMPTPYWRRPSKTNGKPGIVTCVSLKEFNVDDINAMIHEQNS